MLYNIFFQKSAFFLKKSGKKFGHVKKSLTFVAELVCRGDY